MTFSNLDPAEMLRLEQERSAQLETYAADLNRTYAELRRHLHHMTVLHEVNLRIASALDPDEVLAGVVDSLGQMLAYRTAAVYLMDLDVAVPLEGALEGLDRADVGLSNPRARGDAHADACDFSACAGGDPALLNCCVH